MSKFSKVLRIFIPLCIALNPFLSLKLKAEEKKFKLRVEHRAEREPEEERKYLELVIIESIQEDLLLDGDIINFQVPSKLADELKLPQNSILETKLHFEKNKVLEEDKKAFLEIIAAHDSHGQSLKCKGKLRLDIDKQKHSLKSKIENNKTASTASNIVTGSIVATIDSLEYGGLPLILLSNGFSAVAAAGIGALKGALDSTRTKEIISRIPSETKMKLRVLEDFELIDKLYSKAIVSEAKNASELGIDLSVEECKKFHSYNFGESLALNLKIQNFSGIDFDISDLVLVNKNSSKEFLLNPLLSSFDQNNFEVKGNSKKNLTVIYSLGKLDKLANYQLRIINPLDSEHKIYFPVSID